MSRSTLLVLALLTGCTASDIFNGGAWGKTSDWMYTGDVQKPREEVARIGRGLSLRGRLVVLDQTSGAVVADAPSGAMPDSVSVLRTAP